MVHRAGVVLFMKKPFDFTHLSASDISFVDGLYHQYQYEPTALEDSWRAFFQGFEFAAHAEGTPAKTQSSSSATAAPQGEAQLRKEFNVFRLIQAYRARGHLLSDTNPIRPRKDRDARVSLGHYGLGEGDLDEVFLCGEFVGLGHCTLREIVNHLQAIYCQKIGFEYMHIANTDIRRWFRERIENTAKKINFPIEKKKRILQKLNEGTVFENFLQTKYVGQKRFSLEGGESTIPGLDFIINHGAEHGAREFVIGMAHRGRLNVLANIVGKTYEYIFNEFEGGSLETLGDGDVKYHLGFTSIMKTTNGKEVYLKLLPNPSHLEAVSPVVLGYNRAQCDIVYNEDASKIVPIVIHGDAAVAGQGVVYETLQMSKLPGYNAGGTIHFIINNQIGFTTDFEDARSSHYCVSVAKTIDVPVLHVNGDDPEAVVYACELAVEFRQKFGMDVFVDMVCYRKHGHNEGDEPKYTQPHLYGLIAKQKNPREIYLEKLLHGNEIQSELANEMQEQFKNLLSDRFNSVRQKEIPVKKQGPHKEWAGLDWSKHGDFQLSPETGVKRETLDEIINALTTVPEGFKTLRKAQKILDDRKKNYLNDTLDWSQGELLAYGSLLLEGNHIRFSGQDVIRGTFSHRHAKVFDEYTNQAYCGLDNIREGQGKMRIYNSLLSEYAVLGFEYGYSQGSPRSLVIWEAQFGDFANGAQIMIDQFISSCESKWRRMTGLVMLLPHGYEGAGPEHSNARPERFLQLCAEDNMVVANCTTPANFFHILRRQLIWPFRKPLVVMTPKSLLRDPRCVSSVAELTSGRFQEVIDDNWVDPSNVKKVLFCTGKVYYDLLEKQRSEDRKDVAIVRLEQLYPMAEEQVQKVLSRYPKASLTWVQEEPLNMGGWMHLGRWPELFKGITCVSRKSSASPATGFAAVHAREQEQILNKAFS
jgi:2-oxoglutarate dehydrogenase E1 component